MQSVLTKNQSKTLSKVVIDNGCENTLRVTIIYDDRYNNGHNTFAITGELGRDIGGSIHDIIVEHCPELAYLIKWHLCSSDGPLHYIANTTYLAGDKEWNGKPKKRELDAARRSAIWPDAIDDELTKSGLEDRLNARLPSLLNDFREAIESLSFTF